MIILISGTPGTGKTTISRLLADRIGFEIFHISDFATRDVTVATEGETKILDEKKLEEKIKAKIKGDAIIDGHLSSSFDIGDFVIVSEEDLI